MVLSELFILRILYRLLRPMSIISDRTRCAVLPELDCAKRPGCDSDDAGRSLGPKSSLGQRLSRTVAQGDPVNMTRDTS